MRRSATMTTAALALLFALLAGPTALAQDSDKLRTKTPQEQIDELRKDLQDLKKTSELSTQLNAAEAKIVAERLDRIEAQLRKMGGRRADTFTPDAPLRTGTIQIDNELAVPATVTIDGVSYTVRPGRTRTLSAVPAGAIRYWIDASGFSASARRSRVDADQTLKITVYDPREE